MKTGVRVQGRNGSSLDNKFHNQGVSTLHGIFTHDFPNLCWFGGSQGGAASNNVHMLDAQAKHLAHIVTDAERRWPEHKDSILVEPTVGAEEAWSMECMMGAA